MPSYGWFACGFLAFPVILVAAFLAWTFWLDWTHGDKDDEHPGDYRM